MKHIILPACVALMLAPAATAATWTFDNATYTRETLSFADPFNPTTISESGTITGSFDYDAAANVYSNVSVSVTRTSAGAPLVDTFSAPAPINDPGRNAGPVTFTPATATQAYFQATPNPSLFVTPFVTFVFADPLTEAGGTVGLSAWRQDACDIPTCSSLFAVGAATFFVSGNVMAPSAPPPPIPLPAALPLLLASFGGLALFRRLRSSPATEPKGA
ncbi:MAG: VPLPA-CTERM sorting domain-containing protein [Pseudomonadota bacterium]